MRLDLTTLKLFLAVVEERSISRAAKREHLTGPAISKRVAEIEQSFGVQLLVRHSGGVRPTPAGRLLAAEARHLADKLDQLSAKLSEYAEGDRGEVRVSSTASGLARRLPEDLKDFASKYPKVGLQIKERRSPDVVKAVRDGDADLGVFTPQASLPCDDLEVHPYEEGRLVLVTPALHPLSKRRSVTLATAAKCDFIGVSKETNLGALLGRMAAKHGIEFKTRIEVMGHEPVRRLVQAGMGLGILPDWAVPYARAVNLSCIPLADREALYTVKICTRPHDTLPMPTRRLLAHLTSTYD